MITNVVPLRRLSVILAALLLLTTAATVAAARPAVAFSWNSSLAYISNPTTALVIDVRGESTADRAAIQGWSFNGNYHEYWRISIASNGDRILSAMHSGKCLDVQWGSPANGAPVWQWPCNNGNTQRWILEPSRTLGPGDIAFRLRNRGSGKCLEVPGGTKGAQLIQRDCDGSVLQDWRDGDYLTNPSRIEVPDVWLADTAPGAQVVMWTFNGGTNQGWWSQNSSNGSINIRSAHGLLLCLGVRGRSIWNGAVIEQQTCIDNDDNQKWWREYRRTDSTGHAIVRYRNLNSWKCLDIDAGAATIGAPLVQWDCHGGWNQEWRDILGV